MNKFLSRFFNDFVVFLAFVLYFEFFKLMIVPYTFRILSQVFVCALMAVLIIIRIIYNPERRKITRNFAGPLLLLIIGAIPSYFVANAYHNQSLLISSFTNRILC